MVMVHSVTLSCSSSDSLFVWGSVAWHGFIQSSQHLPPSYRWEWGFRECQFYKIKSPNSESVFLNPVLA